MALSCKNTGFLILEVSFDSHSLVYIDECETFVGYLSFKIEHHYTVVFDETVLFYNILMVKTVFQNSLVITFAKLYDLNPPPVNI